MDDRELLELAAKAAGIEHWSTNSPDGLVIGLHRNGPTIWNPLADDGDALRLAVSLGINLEIGDIGFGDVQAGKRDDWACEWLDGDHPHAAVRRAIVRAAAEIGKKVEAPQAG